MEVDILYVFHVFLSIVLLTIPFWPLEYLSYGVYVPFIISFIWIVFDGCPLTKIQSNLSSENFTQDLLKMYFPEITKQYTEHLNTFILIAITTIGFNRLLYKIESN
jgi:hypothetical protein